MYTALIPGTPRMSSICSTASRVSIIGMHSTCSLAASIPAKPPRAPSAIGPWAAAPGTVLVGEATWALVAHAAHGRRVEPLAAKGKSEPLAAWLLESVDPLAPGHRRRLDLPMVGRATELGLVRLTADRTAQLQRPHLVTMLGQPGIGKSRLVSELQHAEQATTLAGHCRATASASPWLVPGKNPASLAPRKKRIQ